jgi:hypothetical protein
MQSLLDDFIRGRMMRGAISGEFLRQRSGQMDGKRHGILLRSHSISVDFLPKQVCPLPPQPLAGVEQGVILEPGIA